MGKTAVKTRLPHIVWLLLALPLLFGACRRTSHNGDLDGYWQIRTIEYTPEYAALTGTAPVAEPRDRFISINLELLQLDNPGPTDELTGVISYSKKEGTLGVDFPYNPTDAQLAFYGFSPNPVMLQVVRADRSHLVLRSDIATVTCHRF